MTATTPAQAWVAALRPKTLPASLAPIGLGVALAIHDGVFQPMLAVAALLTALFLQLASNLANDYFDFVKGTDGPDRLGPPRACQMGWLKPQHVLYATILSVVLASVTGLYLVLHADWVLGAIGVAAIISAIAYTGGPKPLGYLGLGDVLVFIFFGPVAVIGTYWLQARTVSAGAVVGGIAVGALVTAILVVNNLRDREGDARSGKRTLAVRLGAQNTRIQYTVLLGVGILLPALAAAVGVVGPGWASSLLLLPLAWKLNTAVRSLDGRALNPMLGQTALLALSTALALSFFGGLGGAS